MVPAIMSLKEWPDRTKKVKKERAASAPERNKGTSTVKRLPAQSNYKAEPPAGVKGKLKLEGGVKGGVKVKAEQKDQAETDSNLGRLQTSDSSLKFKTDKGSVIVKAEQKDPIVKAEQKDPAKTDSNLGRLQTSSSSTPKPTAQKAATTFKFTTSNPGRRPCPMCGKLLDRKFIPAHLLVTHGTVKSKQFPNCWPD